MSWKALVLGMLQDLNPDMYTELCDVDEGPVPEPVEGRRPDAGRRDQRGRDRADERGNRATFGGVHRYA